jgi:hypothetical protein
MSHHEADRRRRWRRRRRQECGSLTRACMHRRREREREREGTHLLHVIPGAEDAGHALVHALCVCVCVCVS